MLKDECDKELSAKTVFKLVIEDLRKDMVKMSSSRISGEGISPNEIHWVLTVPAIWNDSAKQFMRECANEVRMIINVYILSVLLKSPIVNNWKKCAVPGNSNISFGHSTTPVC